MIPSVSVLSGCENQAVYFLKNKLYLEKRVNTWRYDSTPNLALHCTYIFVLVEDKSLILQSCIHSYKYYGTVTLSTFNNKMVNLTHKTAA